MVYYYRLKLGTETVTLWLDTMTDKKEEILNKLSIAMDLRSELITRRAELKREDKDTTEISDEINSLRSEIIKLRGRLRSYHRRELKKEADISDFTSEQWKRLKKESGGICSYCGEPYAELTADHIIPLPKGGNHTLENITVACRRCNNRKGMRTPDEAHMRNRPGVSREARWRDAKNRLAAVFERRPDLPPINSPMPRHRISKALDIEILELLAEQYEFMEPWLEEWRVASKRLEDVLGYPSDVSQNHETDFNFPSEIEDLTDEFLEGWIYRLRKKCGGDSQSSKSS